MTWAFYIAAAACALWGQALILQQRFAAGVAWTLAGAALAALAQIKPARWAAWLAAARRAWPGIRARLEQAAKTWSGRGQEPRGAGLLAPSQAAPKTAAAPAVLKTSTPKTGAVLKTSTAKTVAPFDALGLVVFIPRNVFLVLGAFLILASQPLLFTENFVPGLVLLLPGLACLSYAFLTKEAKLRVGRLDAIIRTTLLALPGLVCVAAGTYLTRKYLEVNFLREAIGIGLNSLGVLLLLALMPRVLPDPEPEANPMEQPTGVAGTRRGLLVKAGLVALAAVLWLLLRTGVIANYTQAVMVALAGLAALLLSFPWSWRRAVPSAPNALQSAAGRILRLAAWGLALYWGYRGQALISHEQVYPGLYYFLAAAAALVVALREPDPAGPDTLREPPLAWYWEALGLVLVLAVAAWLRTHLLDSVPFGIECDEAGAGHHAVDILKNQFNSLTVHPSGRPLFMLLSKVVAFQFFGIDNVGMRLMAALEGVGGVLALYLLARYFFGPRVALACAALLAVSRWHIHFSRFGWSNTLMAALQTIGFYFILKGASSRRKWHFVLAGVSLALSIHTETAARMVPFIGAAILGYFALTQRRFLRRQGLPVVALVLGAWLAGANLFLFWMNKPRYLFNRVYEVSLFSQDANAPKDTVRGLVESSRLSLLQMNWHGDTRTRHNGGLSGEPVLDFGSAVLFLLGFGYTLYHWKRRRYAVLFAWFFGFMGASIFALEAPQSHRAFGVIPTLFIFTGVLLDRSRRLLQESFGRWGVAAGAAALLILLVPIARTNYHKYFDATPGFDSHCTAAARYMGKFWPQAYHTVMSAYLWMGHPPFILYARDVDGHFDYSAAEAVPFRMDKDKDVLFTLIFEYPPLLPAIQHFYPQGVFREETHPVFQLLFRSWGVKKEDIAATRGLKAKYWNNTSWSGAPAVVRKDSQLNLTFDNATWPLSGPGSVSWEGTILVPHWGTYTLHLYATDEIELRLGNQPALAAANGSEATRTLRLAAGLHRLRVRARHWTPNGRILLAWSSSTGFPFHFNPLQDPFPKQAVPATHLFTYPEPAGLRATYYDTDHFAGRARLENIEPALLFVWNAGPYGLAAPVSVAWRGWLQIDQPGAYAFDLEQSGYGEVEIGGRVVVAKGEKPSAWQPAPAGPNPVILTAGRHPVTVRWSPKYGYSFKFWWTPPQGERAIVPPGALIPAQE